MATEAIGRTRDPRLILFADNVRRPQRMQVKLMEAMCRNSEQNR